MRLIDADALIADLKHDSDICTKFLADGAGTKLQRDLIRVYNDRQINTILSINAAPTVDAVEVIRCKDCVDCKTAEFSHGRFWKYCETIGSTVNDNDYCCWAERRKDNG